MDITLKDGDSFNIYVGELWRMSKDAQERYLEENANNLLEKIRVLRKVSSRFESSNLSRSTNFWVQVNFISSNYLFFVGVVVWGGLSTVIFCKILMLGVGMRMWREVRRLRLTFICVGSVLFANILN